MSHRWKPFQKAKRLTSTVSQVTDLTSDSELSSSARVGALRSLFLWLSGAPPPWLGPVVPLAKDWVLTANFLDASGVSAVEKWIHFIFVCQQQEDECNTHTSGKDLLIKYFLLKRWARRQDMRNKSRESLHNDITWAAEQVLRSADAFSSTWERTEL